MYIEYYYIADEDTLEPLTKEYKGGELKELKKLFEELQKDMKNIIIWSREEEI